MSCGPLDPVDYTTNTSTQGDNLFMDQITFMCVDGYEVTGGDLVRNCASDGSWDGTEPTCESKIKCFLTSLEFLCFKIVVLIEINCGDLLLM